MEQKTNTSEIARLLAQIEVEYRAAQQGLTGFAESARHEAITARMANLGRLHEDLRAIAGNDATRLLVERIEALSE